MSEDKAVFRACGNCGCRIDGFCVSEVAKENNCAMDPKLPCWIPEGFAKVVAQCTEKPEEQKIYPNMVDPRGKWEREDTIKKNNQEPDFINHPAHYTAYPVEVKDIIRDVLTRAYGQDGYRAYCLGNEIKYRMRAGLKGEATEDIGKAMKYKEFRECGD